jgi:hypothetical protein
MTFGSSVLVIERGRKLYEEQLRGLLEPEQTGRYVAVGQESGRYFLGDTGSEALAAALAEMPDGFFYLARVGYGTADSLGGRSLRIKLRR